MWREGYWKHIFGEGLLKMYRLPKNVEIFSHLSTSDGISDIFYAVGAIVENKFPAWGQ